MSEPQLEANKEIVRRFLAAIDRHDADEVFEILHPDHELEFPGNDEPMDREGHWRLISGYHAAFNDMKHRPDLQVAEGDRVVTRGTILGTNTGSLHGQPATGKSVRVQFMNMARIVDGRICGLFSLLDSDTLKAQLGASEVHYVDETAS